MGSSMGIKLGEKGLWEMDGGTKQWLTRGWEGLSQGVGLLIELWTWTEVTSVGHFLMSTFGNQSM